MKGKYILNKVALICIGAAIVFLILAALTKNIFCFGLSFSVLGLGILLFLVAGSAMIKSAAAIVGCYFLIFGLLLAFSEIIGKYLRIGDRFIQYVLCIGLGGIFLGVFLLNTIKVFECRTRVSAVYLGAEINNSRAGSGYVPRFRFTYKGMKYDNTTGEVYSRRKLEKKYRIGETYDIYISLKNPGMLRTQRKWKASDLILLIMGILFIIVAFR